MRHHSMFLSEIKFETNESGCCETAPFISSLSGFLSILKRKSSAFFHTEVCKKNSLSFYLLLLNNLIISLFKERLRRNRSVSRNISLHSLLQLIANSSCNTFTLVIGVYKQTVKVPRFIDIPKPHNDFIINSNYTIMLLKIPFSILLSI